MTREALSRNHRATVCLMPGEYVSWSVLLEGSETPRKVGFVTMALVWENV